MPIGKSRDFYQQKLKNKTAANYDLIDALMFIPISNTTQIRFNLYKNLKTNELGIDIRHYNIHKGNFLPSKTGIRIPFKDLPQIMTRLNWLMNKYKL